MTITICDNCGKKLKSGEYVVIGNKGYFNTKSLCNPCGKSVIAIINKLEKKKRISK